VDTALAVVRFLHYAAAIQLFGIAVFESWMAPSSLADGLLPESRRVASFSASTLLASGLVWLALTAGSMGDGWGDVLDPQVLWLVLTATEFGHVWVAVLSLAAVAVIVSLTIGPRRWGVLAVIAALALGALGLTGHATIDTGPLGAASRASQAIHLVSSGFWFGSLLPVVFCLRQIHDPRYAVAADAALRRFSGIGHAAVALALATGVANSWFILRNASLSFGSAYQLLLAAKVTLVGTMVLLAIVNRYVFMPRIPNGSGARQLRNGTIAEIAMGSVVIAIVGALGMLPPS
jgi:copper resistance protein D